MKREDVSFIKQMIDSIQEAVLQLEKAYKKKDADRLNKTKKIISELQNRVLEEISK